MKGPIVECVANVSEGRRPEIIQFLADAIRNVDKVKLLHVDPGHDANRTVFTFAGEGIAVAEAAFQLFSTACQHIDMRNHQGNHPRMGIVDVCPFVPLDGATLDYCSQLARDLGKRVWEKLQVPIYLYESAASAPHRRNLAEVRRGEYEGLAAKMKQADWQVDYGTSDWNPKTGTAIIGARPFLVAWNINLATTDVSIAKHIAARLRGSGRIVKQKDGSKTRIKGQFSGLKAIGWELKEHNICQVSTNVVDPDNTSLYDVYQACCEMAIQLGTKVTGSELIGLVPEKYLLTENSHPDKATAIEQAVEQLGFADLSPFNWKERVLEVLVVCQA